MLKNIRFLFQKIFSSKFIIKGKCKQCGECCKSIVFHIEDKIITTEEEFEKLKSFDKKYTNFEINGKGKNDELIFKCKKQLPDGRCGVYKWRSLYCRFYPNISQKFIYKYRDNIKNCGYHIEVSKKFDEYLN